MKIEAKVNFVGKKPIFPKYYVEKYIDAYNAFVHKINEHLEGWNNEYSGPDDGFEEGSAYNKYIQERAQSIANTVYNTNKVYKAYFKGFNIGEHLDFNAYLFNGSRMELDIRVI